MIEKYIHKGAIITGFNFTDVGAAGTPLSEVSIGMRDSSMTVTIKGSFFSKDSDSTVAFRFLPYAQGSINYCESMGRDVISGIFTGCIMAHYMRDGILRVCHVSTGNPNDCQNKWNTIKLETTVTEGVEFKPHLFADGNLTFGLITSTGDRYAIGCQAKDLLVQETRSIQQILIDDAPTTRIEATQKERLEMATWKSKNKKIVKALKVISFNRVR